MLSPSTLPTFYSSVTELTTVNALLYGLTDNLVHV